jgi:hypothetical protein
LSFLSRISIASRHRFKNESGEISLNPLAVRSMNPKLANTGYAAGHDLKSPFIA